MKFLESEKVLDILLAEKVITAQQKTMVMEEKSRQYNKLMRALPREERNDKNAVDIVDIIASFVLPCAFDKTKPVDEEQIMRAIARHYRLPFKKLDPLELDMAVVTKTVPRHFAQSHMILPIERKGKELLVASYNPECEAILKDIEQANQVKTSLCITTKTDIRRILSEFFGFQRSISAAENQYAVTNDSLSIDIGNLERFVKISAAKEITSSDEHIKSAVNHIFHYALEQRASDIHIEPKRNSCMVRFRIDGSLHTIYNLPKAVHSALISRIKFLARLDIAEKRRPQDGRIKLGAKENHEVEVRVSTVPVSFGEKIVLRLLDPTVIYQSIKDIGFSKRDYDVYNALMHAPHGIILVTGPTGSGKSTTLYSTLREISSPEVNIVTVEDPVEMVHEDFNQIAVQPLIDVTFSTILRNILRQDPDIIMIGEIRDHETAAHAVQAAMTGHLVFSTLHTNDAISAIDRLQDLGLEPYMISSTLIGCMAQRLVKTICPHCKETYTVDSGELRNMGFPVNTEGPVTLMRGAGCRECRNTGYKGRTGIFEIFPMTSGLKKLVNIKGQSTATQQLAIREGMTTLREDAWKKVQAGITTYEEVLRVTTEETFILPEQEQSPR